jgi:hypothetical protein
MRSVSATEAKQRLAGLLDAAQREPVVIRRQKRDVAILQGGLGKSLPTCRSPGASFDA